MATALLRDDRYLLHDLPGHPEHAERLRAIDRVLTASGLLGELRPIQPLPAAWERIVAVHDEGLLRAVERLAAMGGGHIDGDTYAGPDSWEVALLAAGAAVQAVDAVVGGEVDNAFALVRPPGHHATGSRAMGFCLINNVAVAARHAIEGLGLARVAIVDWDVHHGNGTQDIFYRDGRVLFCSTHASPLYPGTGALGELGRDGGYGATLNLALPYQVGDLGYRAAFERCILPALRRFHPELILVSAGYDAHWADPLGPMALSAQGFAALATLLRDAAAELCGGRLVCVLEGGYDLDALAACVVMTLRVLLGHAPGDDPLGPARAAEPDISRLLGQLAAVHPLLQDGDTR
jgi:acetoin utilization deacetylase AcuC-like enzyme